MPIMLYERNGWRIETVSQGDRVVTFVERDGRRLAERPNPPERAIYGHADAIRWWVEGQP